MNVPPKYSIFIADDDEDDRFILQRVFNEHHLDCNLSFFADGQELLTKLTHNETTSLPALILLDLNMPIMDGFTALQHLKSNNRLRIIPTVILTTSNSSEDVRRCYQAGANAYLSKPFRYDELVYLMGELRRYWLEIVQLPR